MKPVNKKELQRWKDDVFWKMAVESRGKCAYCDLESEDFRVLAHFHKDHLIAETAGGSNDACNMVFCCGRCNNFKNNKVSFDLQSVVDGKPTPAQRLELIAVVRRHIEQNFKPYYAILQEEIHALKKEDQALIVQGAA